MRKSPLPIRPVYLYGLYCGLFLLWFSVAGLFGLFAAENSTRGGFTPVATPNSSLSAPSGFRQANGVVNAPNALPLESLSPTQDEPSEELTSLVADGEKLVAEKRWSEARYLLEEGLKHRPNDLALRQLYLESRAHIEVAQRYHDVTFCEFLAKTDKDEIIYLCDEVLGNIQTWHVDSPDWKDLFRLGMRSLAIAMSEESFLRQNRVADQVVEKLPGYAQALVQYAESLSVRDHNELRGNIFRIAESVQRNTGISGISVIMELLCGMVNSLDSYSAWLTGGQVTDIFSLIDGHFIGLGIYIDAVEIPKALVITKVIPGSPADMAQLKSGEKIISIDGRPVSGEESADWLQGPEGSRVTLTVAEPDESSIREVVITRRPFDFPSVENVTVTQSESGAQIASFKISTFQKSTVDEVRHCLQDFEKNHIDALVIDLRNNPGGLLEKAVELSDLFLENGTIVQTRGRRSSQVRRADAREVCSIPLVILIDENSASAAEIFAGAMQENGRAVVVGVTSYGKGTIQAIIQLESQKEEKLLAGLRLTTEKFYSPKGRPYSGNGVVPDVDLAEEYMAARPLLDEDGQPQQSAGLTDRFMERGLEEAARLSLRRTETTTASVRPVQR